MGVADRKEREKEEMKVKILEAAKKLFLGKGFEKTSIRNIADAIEYSPGTIYLYFKDKNELLFNLHVEAFNGLTRELSNIDPELSPIDALEVMGEQYIKFAFENPELYELMFVMEAPMESLECKEEVWDDGMKAFDLLRFLVDRCQKDGYLATYEVDDASLMIWSFVHGLVTLKSRKRLDMFCDSEEDSLTRMMRSFNVFLKQIKCGKS
ncbi:TetR/AcrR family transcriptional regulator [Jiulongibacter sediminis]|uniref:TetR family transcriptional regulator n=1 Tax=Jiulongibacter sediminis TaxID=1605367 RepID=A0A0N8H9W4_9BACT|nr:TetR/AcrR family transcriptional regulator [Jiulongibacter sediminis]KPM48500.1 TetR family transcriptional regulator [Jiulongibacter sediminis]TBX25038.1 TetR family transcriptional regulator [Jiulongibacter sediminis]